MRFDHFEKLRCPTFLPLAEDVSEFKNSSQQQGPKRDAICMEAETVKSLPQLRVNLFFSLG